MRSINTPQELIIANKLYVHAALYGGLTVDIDGNKPLSGYMVGIKGIEFNSVSECDPFRIAEFIQSNPEKWYGSWKDTDGKVYIDVCQNVQKLQDALDLGKAYEQISIYDVVTSEVIYL